MLDTYFFRPKNQNRLLELLKLVIVRKPCTGKIFYKYEELCNLRTKHLDKTKNYIPNQMSDNRETFYYATSFNDNIIKKKTPIPVRID